MDGPIQLQLCISVPNGVSPSPALWRLGAAAYATLLSIADSLPRMRLI